MMPRIAVALLLVLCGATPAPAQTQADPVAYVQAIYAALYQRDNPPAWYGQNYSARLKKLIDADQKSAHKNGDAGHFDWDPIINAQDWKLTDIRISLVSQAAGQAVVDASFHNLDSDQHMRFNLVMQAGKWAIDDMRRSTNRAGRCRKSSRVRPTRFPTRRRNNPLQEETMPDGYAHPEYLVETDWLAAHLGDPKLVVLDCTVHLIPDPKITYTVKSGREDFEKGHIPGAQFLDLQADLSDNGKLPLRFMLPTPSGFRRRRCAASAFRTTARSSPTAPPTRNGRRGCGG